MGSYDFVEGVEEGYRTIIGCVGWIAFFIEEEDMCMKPLCRHRLFKVEVADVMEPVD